MSSGVDVDIPKTFGALLIGAVFASFLSGGITVQTLVYFKLYPSDGSNVKTLVPLIWSSQWEYFIRLYGKAEKIDYISTFFAHRIFLLSKRKWYLVAPVSLCVHSPHHAYPLFAFLIRLHYRSFIQFREHVRWLFTLGLALSSAVDVLITSSLFILDGVIDTLILYTFETGSVTCAATIVSMICWISIPTQLIFMALHFIIGKCE
ncbi:hypothetical protein C8R41DRAFT_897804 [Lentinula lateritia]|uniref:Uncharacterized protein n=1 Tax=Lentinula lateritia TaxID=40482 RepID=A0ABQ8V3L9_9AGAR|nr:hypothetical protein C8R41DRAFT_897804 [Lentinula lateritia]